MQKLDVVNSHIFKISEIHTTTAMYSNGKIYTLMCDDGNYYIGATVSDLRFRLKDHKQAAKKYPNRKIYAHINLIGWERVSMELIENYPCNSKTELNLREDYYIKRALEDTQSKCLNTLRAYLTDKELDDYRKAYREANRDKIIEYKDNYRKENVERIRAYNKKYVEKNAEAVKERQHAYYEANKEVITERIAEYREKNKEKMDAYKREWARKKHEETADERAAASEAKREIRQEKSAARVARDRTIHTCDCGGSYQAYQKKRHMESKKHLAFLERGTSTTSEAYKAARKRELQDYKNAWGRKKNAEVAAATADIRAATKAEKRAEKIAATCERVNEVHKCNCGGEYRIYQKKRHEGTAKHRAYAALTVK